MNGQLALDVDGDVVLGKKHVLKLPLYANESHVTNGIWLMPRSRVANVGIFLCPVCLQAMTGLLAIGHLAETPAFGDPQAPLVEFSFNNVVEVSGGTDFCRFDAWDGTHAYLPRDLVVAFGLFRLYGSRPEVGARHVTLFDRNDAVSPPNLVIAASLKPEVITLHVESTLEGQEEALTVVPQPPGEHVTIINHDPAVKLHVMENASLPAGTVAYIETGPLGEYNIVNTVAFTRKPFQFGPEDDRESFAIPRAVHTSLTYGSNAEAIKSGQNPATLECIVQLDTGQWVAPFGASTGPNDARYLRCLPLYDEDQWKEHAALVIKGERILDGRPLDILSNAGEKFVTVEGERTINLIADSDALGQLLTFKVPKLGEYRACWDSTMSASEHVVHVTGPMLAAGGVVMTFGFDEVPKSPTLKAQKDALVARVRAQVSEGTTPGPRKPKRRAAADPGYETA